MKRMQRTGERLTWRPSSSRCSLSMPTMMGENGPLDNTTDAELRDNFYKGVDRYQSMLKLSSRWALQGVKADDIESALYAMFDNAGISTKNKDGIDLRRRVPEMARTAVIKFGESRREVAPQGAIPAGCHGGGFPRLPADPLLYLRSNRADVARVEHQRMHLADAKCEREEANQGEHVVRQKPSRAAGDLGPRGISNHR